MAVPTNVPRLNAIELMGMSEKDRLMAITRVLDKHSDNSAALAGRLTVAQNLYTDTRDLRVTIPEYAWTDATLENSWVAAGGSFETPGYRIDEFGMVHLRGAVSVASNTAAVMTLPAGYRPSGLVTFATDVNGAHARLSIASGGAVQISAGTTNASLRCSFEAVAAAAPPAFSGGAWPMKIDTSKLRAVRHVEIWNVTDLAGGSNVTRGALGASFAPLAGGILLTRINGLSPGRSYSLTVVMFGG